MRSMSRTALTAAVPLAVLAVWTAAASASPPEWGRCQKVAAGSGRFGNAGCTVEGGEKKYEWVPGAGPKDRWKILSATATTLTTVKGETISCKGATGTGEVTSATSADEAAVDLTGCALATGAPCRSEFASLEGEVKIAGTGTLGVIKKGITPAKDIVGLDINGPFLNFKCGAAERMLLKGSVIVHVKANAMTLSETLKYTSTAGKQKPEAFEGMPQDVLFTGPEKGVILQTGLTLTATQTYEEKLEINSVI